MEKRISIVKNDLTIDLVKLRSFITEKWQSKQLYKNFFELGLRGSNIYTAILNEIGDYADLLDYIIEKEAQKKLNSPDTQLDWFNKYPKWDVRSIGFALVDFLSMGNTCSIEELTYDDIPAILEFIDTPPDKALEGWAQWEHYWSTIDLPARRKKLLEETDNQ